MQNTNLLSRTIPVSRRWSSCMKTRKSWPTTHAGSWLSVTSLLPRLIRSRLPLKFLLIYSRRTKRLLLRVLRRNPCQGCPRYPLRLLGHQGISRPMIPVFLSTSLTSTSLTVCVTPGSLPHFRDIESCKELQDRLLMTQVSNLWVVFIWWQKQFVLFSSRNSWEK